MRKLSIGLALGLTVAASFAACGGTAPPPPAPEAPAPEPTMTEPALEPTESAGAEPAPESETEAPPRPDVPPEGATVDRIMQAHFKDALMIREAVIAGRPEQAAQAATVISNIQDLDKLPKGWQPFVEHMQETARRVTNGTSAAATAAATADLGVSCGLCHQKLGGPKPSSDPMPESGASVESRMQRHVWATERLWEGLAAPSNDAWNKGAKALSTEPFPKELLKEGGVDVKTSANDFTKLVAKAPGKKTTTDRAALYAELLVTCGTCHRGMDEAN